MQPSVPTYLWLAIILQMDRSLFLRIRCCRGLFQLGCSLWSEDTARSSHLRQSGR